MIQRSTTRTGWGSFRQSSKLAGHSYSMVTIREWFGGEWERGGVVKLLGEWKLIRASAFWELLSRMASVLKIKCPTLCINGSWLTFLTLLSPTSKKFSCNWKMMYRNEAMLLQFEQGVYEIAVFSRYPKNRWMITILMCNVPYHGHLIKVITKYPTIRVYEFDWQSRLLAKFAWL